MSTIVIPDGVALRDTSSDTTFDPVTSNRSTRYRFDLLNKQNTVLGELRGVSGGSIDWTANSAVKGGGQLAVKDYGDLHNMEIRVEQSLLEIYAQDFDKDTDGWYWNTAFNFFDPAGAVTTSTDATQGTVLAVNWANPAAGSTKNQVLTKSIGDLVEDWDVLYTMVLRVKSTAGVTLRLSDMFSSNGEVLPSNPNVWQTVIYTFTPQEVGGLWAALVNSTPAAGQTTWIDKVRVYRGEAAGFNGEVSAYVPFDWQRVRVRPVLLLDGMPELPLGHFIPSAPKEDWTSKGRSWQIELLDRSSIIQQDCVDRSYSVAAGTNIIAQVKKLIASTGEPTGAITASSATLKNGLVWKAGTSKLTIINNLLDAAGYLSLWVDGMGQFRIEAYVEPAKRGVVYQLLDNERSIYTPDFTLDNDIYAVPNKVIAIAQGDSETEGVVGVATNENAASPYSYQSRGRWVVDVIEGVELAEGADQKAAIKAYAKRRLAALSAPAETLEIQHAPVPNLRVNNVVRFRRTLAGIDTLFTVSKTSIDFDPTSLAKSTLSNVANVETATSE